MTRRKSWMLNIISSGSKVRKFITRSIFIGSDSSFYTRSLTQRSKTFLPKSRPGYAPINTSFLLKNVSELTLEPKISLSEAKLQKFITNSPFIWLSPFSDMSYFSMSDIFCFHILTSKIALKSLRFSLECDGLKWTLEAQLHIQSPYLCSNFHYIISFFSHKWGRRKKNLSHNSVKISNSFMNPKTLIPKSMPGSTLINTSFLLKNVSELTLESKISLSEANLQKFITNSQFIWLSPFSDRSLFSMSDTFCFHISTSKISLKAQRFSLERVRLKWIKICTIACGY